MTGNKQNRALIIIDVQDGLGDPRLGKRNNPDAEANMARLLAQWRQRKGLPCSHKIMNRSRFNPLQISPEASWGDFRLYAQSPFDKRLSPFALPFHDASGKGSGDGVEKKR